MAKILVATALLSVSLYAGLTRSKNTDFYGNGRVIGGTEARDGAYPYQVSLKWSGRHWCGGSILNNEWILTSALCARMFVINSAVVGTNSIRSGGDSYEVDVMIEHSDFDGSQRHNDVGLVKVKGPIIFKDNVQPIRLDKENVEDQADCLLTGWGEFWQLGEFSVKLREINLTTITRTDCQLSHSRQITDKQICTQGRYRKGACSGDGGSPLVRTVGGEKRQIGIVSLNNACKGGVPDVYTRVSSYIDWINEHCGNCISSY